MFVAEEKVVAGEDEVQAVGGGGAGLAGAQVAGVGEGFGGDGLFGEVGLQNFGRNNALRDGISCLIQLNILYNDLNGP